MPRVTQKPTSTPPTPAPTTPVPVRKWIKVHLEEGKKVETRSVLADVYGCFAVYQSIHRVDNNVDPSKIPWVATHVGTGRYAGTFPSQAEAIRLAVMLDGLGDWSDVKYTDKEGLLISGKPIAMLARAGKWDEAEAAAAKYVLFG